MNIKDNASLAMIPVAYKEDKLYSVIPNDGDGDFDFSRSSKGTRVNKGGFIEEMDNDIPRLDYPLLDGVVQDCPTLLLEPQRTNLTLYSQEIDNAYWSKTNGTATANQAVSPDGSLNSEMFAENTTTSAHFISRNNIAISSSTSYTLSVFAKSNGRNTFRLFKDDGVGSFAFFNLQNGTIGSKSNITGSKIEYFGNGWYRCSITFTSTSTSTYVQFLLAQNGETTPYLGDGASGFYIYGFQLEAGSYPTSYIKTQGETNGVTRSVDNAQIASGAEDIIGSQNEGTLFIDLEIPYDTTLTDYFQFSISDQNALPNRVFINFRSGEAQFQVFSNSDPVGFCNTPTPKNIRLKIAGSYETDNFVLFKDGFLADDIDTGGTVNFTTQMESIRFADFGNGLKFQAKVYQTMFFKEALTQAELETLTSYDSFKEMATQQLYTVE
jgi:hypothetical protein